MSEPGCGGCKVKHVAVIRCNTWYEVLSFSFLCPYPVYRWILLPQKPPGGLLRQSLFGPLSSSRFCVVFWHPSIDNSLCSSRWYSNDESIVRVRSRESIRSQNLSPAFERHNSLNCYWRNFSFPRSRKVKGDGVSQATYDIGDVHENMKTTPRS